jgi:hypothetical protein
MINKMLGFSDDPGPTGLVEMVGLVRCEYTGTAAVAAVAAAAMPAPLRSRLRLMRRRSAASRSPDMHTFLTAWFGTPATGIVE